MLGRQIEFTETVGAPGQVVPKLPAGLPVSPISRFEARFDEFDPTDADEHVVQEAEELKRVPAPIFPGSWRW